MRKNLRVGAVVLFALLAGGNAAAQEAISAEVLDQITAIGMTKAAFSPGQQKMDSNLAFGLMAATDDTRIAPFRNAINPLTVTDLAPAAAPDSGPGTSGVTIEITGAVSDDLTAAIVASGGVVLYQSPRWGKVTATLPLGAVHTIALRDDVTKLRLPAAAHGNVGALTSQGYISHQANNVVTGLGINGTGVKVGVLSDSASAARIAALIASGDLPPGTAALPGQTGPANGTDEGTAMMEIIHDLAPGAQLLFATAFTSEASFADNILALAAAGCKVIVDDVSYSDDSRRCRPPSGLRFAGPPIRPAPRSRQAWPCASPRTCCHSCPHVCRAPGRAIFRCLACPGNWRAWAWADSARSGRRNPDSPGLTVALKFCLDESAKASVAS